MHPSIETIHFRRWRRGAIIAFALLLVPCHSQPTAVDVQSPVWSPTEQRKEKKSKGEPAAPSQLTLEAPVWSTTQPIKSPTPQPSSPPSDNQDRSEPTPEAFPVVELRANDVELRIGGIALPLNASSRGEMERIISDSIAFSIDKVLGFDQIENLDIRVSLVSPQERKLAAQERNETIAFDAVIIIQSVLEVHDIDRYTIGAFNDPQEQVLFLRALKNTADPAFANVTSVSTVGQGSIVSATPDASPGDDKNKTAGAAIAILVAIAAVLSAIAALIYYHRLRTKGKLANETSSYQVDKLEHGSVPSDRALMNDTMDSSSDEDTEEEIPSEIVVDSSSDDSDPRDGALASDVPDISGQSTSVAPSDEAKSSRDMILVDTISLLSGESIDYDFEDIFRTDGSLGDSGDSRKPVVRRESSLTYASEKEKIDYILPVLELNGSNETKLLDEDDNTVDDEFES